MQEPARHEAGPLKEELDRLRQKNVWRWLLNVLTDWSVILLTFWLVVVMDTWWVYPIALIIIGTRQHALGVLGHEGGHWLVSNHRALNDLLSNLLCFWPMMMILEGFRDFHYKHHQFLGTLQDPELTTKYWSAPFWDLPASRWRIIRGVLLDLCGIGILLYKRRIVLGFLQRKSVKGAQLATSDFFSFWKKGGMSDAFGLGIFWVVVLGVFASVDMLWIPIFWIIALLTSFFASFKMRVWTEHLGTTGTHRFTLPLWYRSLCLPRNIGYHYEHHLYPSVPQWNLPALRACLHPDVPVQSLSALFRSYADMPMTPSGKATADSEFPPFVQG